MEPISYPGNNAGSKITLFGAGLVVLALCTVVGTYRLKKVAEMKYWEKALATYSRDLEQNNRIAKGDSIVEIR